MHQSIQNGIRKRVVSDACVPLIGGSLTEDRSGVLCVTAIHDFHHYLHFLTICSKLTQGAYLTEIADHLVAT